VRAVKFESPYTGTLLLSLLDASRRFILIIVLFFCFLYNIYIFKYYFANLIGEARPPLPPLII
jgi:hypothetical protein